MREWKNSSRVIRNPSWPSTHRNLLVTLEISHGCDPVPIDWVCRISGSLLSNPEKFSTAALKRIRLGEELEAAAVGRWGRFFCYVLLDFRGGLSLLTNREFSKSTEFSDLANLEWQAVSKAANEHGITIKKSWKRISQVFIFAVLFFQKTIAPTLSLFFFGLPLGRDKKFWCVTFLGQPSHLDG